MRTGKDQSGADENNGQHVYKTYTCYYDRDTPSVSIFTAVIWEGWGSREEDEEEE
jgi:hypothetical protein